MSLEEQIIQWRTKMVETLLEKGDEIQSIEFKVKEAEKIVFGSYLYTFKITCPLKKSKELLNVLNEFAVKNECSVNFED